MKIFCGLMWGVLICQAAFASPIVPVPECKIKAKFISDLGKKSLLYEKLRGHSELMPGTCLGEYISPRIIIEILETDTTNAKSCPTTGQQLEVSGDIFTIGNFILLSKGDECFFEQSIQKVADGK
jgi:hypothetical protein